jgi:hypothetical protein
VAGGQHILNGVQLVVGLFVVGLGGLVYLIDRPVHGLPFLGHCAGHASLFAQFLSDVGLIFPAFAHPLGFALLTAAVIGGGRAGAVGTVVFLCGGQPHLVGGPPTALNLLFEAGQHSAFAPWIVARLPEGFAPGFLGTSLRYYFLNGTFDPMDVAAIVAGSGVAFVAVLATQDRGGGRWVIK